MSQPTPTTQVTPSPSVPSAAEQEAASKQVREVGLELMAIKNAMKRLSSSFNGAGKGNENTLKVTAMKVR